MKGWLLVFAKEPNPGQVKTRLCPPLEPEQAARLYACLLEDALAVSAEAADRVGLEPVLAVHPAAARGRLARRAPAGFRVIAQQGTDLGERLAWAFARAAAAGAEVALARGSDSLTLDAASIVEAALALRAADLVLAPDRDGGYGLIGLRRPAPSLFRLPMSEETLLERTLAEARRLRLRAHQLEPGCDLDTAADLAWLAERLARREPPGACPRTLAFLEREGWLRAGRRRLGVPSR